MPRSYSYEQLNPLDMSWFWHIQKPLAGDVEKLSKKYKAILSAAQVLPAPPIPEHEYCRKMNQFLKYALDAGQFNSKDIIFVPGIPTSPMRSLDYLIESISRAYLLAMQRCAEKKVHPIHKEIFLAVAPVFFEIDVSRGPLEQCVQQAHAQANSFETTIYDAQRAKNVFYDLPRNEIVASRYLRRRITAAACQTIIRGCRQAYLYSERSGWLGPVSGIFRHIPKSMYEEIGGRGGSLRNAEFPMRGLAHHSAENILAGFLAEKWLGAA